MKSVFHNPEWIQSSKVAMYVAKENGIARRRRDVIRILVLVSAWVELPLRGSGTLCCSFYLSSSVEMWCVNIYERFAARCYRLSIPLFPFVLLSLIRLSCRVSLRQALPDALLFSSAETCRNTRQRGGPDSRRKITRRRR